MRALLWLTILTPVALADSRLASQIAAIAMEVHGRVGVACLLPGAALDCSFNAGAKLPMQSVYKLPLAMALLEAVEHGKTALMNSMRFIPSDLISASQHSPLRDRYPQANINVNVQEPLRLTVSQSDGIATDILMRCLGGRRLWMPT